MRHTFTRPNWTAKSTIESSAHSGCDQSDRFFAEATKSLVACTRIQNFKHSRNTRRLSVGNCIKYFFANAIQHLQIATRISMLDDLKQSLVECLVVAYVTVQVRQLMTKYSHYLTPLHKEITVWRRLAQLYADHFLIAITVSKVGRVNLKFLYNFHFIFEHRAAILPRWSHLFSYIAQLYQNLIRVGSIAIQWRWVEPNTLFTGISASCRASCTPAWRIKRLSSFVLRSSACWIKAFCEGTR